MKLRHIVLGSLLAIAASSSALAASYNFNVGYNGGGSAVLLAGDNPLSTPVQVGDSFQYDLIAQGGGQWTVLSGAEVFPLFALSVAESAYRSADWTLTLKNNGATVFSSSKTNVSQAFVHMGTNSLALPTGLVFDQWSLNYSLLSSQSVTSTAVSLLPWGGAPEQYSPDVLSFAVAVPEPSTYALMLAGVAGVGMLARRRAKQR